MKLLEINVCSGCKSTGRIASDVARLFVQQNEGNEARIAYGRGYLDCGIETYRITTKNEVRLDALKTRIFDNAGFNNKRATVKFIEWVKAYDPDIIHLHNIHGYYINVKVLFEYLKTSGKKIIWTLHDCWAFTGHCAYFDYAKCERWKKGCHDCPQKKEYPTSVFADCSRKNYEQKKALFTGVPNMTVVTPSEWLTALVKQSFLAGYPVYTIHNGIDTKSFCPTDGDLREKYNLSDKKVLLGVASPWSARKGFQDILKLSDMISDQYRIVAVGLSKEQMEGLPSNVIGIQKTNSKTELAEWYTLADVFLNPTYEDNYPTVNLEAQACGTPVITYRTGGSVESVPAEYVVDCGNVEQLYEKVQFVLNENSVKLIPAVDSNDAYQKYIELIMDV